MIFCEGIHETVVAEITNVNVRDVQRALFCSLHKSEEDDSELSWREVQKLM